MNSLKHIHTCMVIAKEREWKKKRKKEMKSTHNVNYTLPHMHTHAHCRWGTQEHRQHHHRWAQFNLDYGIIFIFRFCSVSLLFMFGVIKFYWISFFLPHRYELYAHIFDSRHKEFSTSIHIHTYACRISHIAISHLHLLHKAFEFAINEFSRLASKSRFSCR